MSDKAVDPSAELNPDVIASGDPVPPPDEGQRLLTLSEAAAYLHVSRGSLRAAIRDGRLPAVRRGWGVRIAMADLLWCAGLSEESAAPTPAEAKSSTSAGFRNPWPQIQEIIDRLPPPEPEVEEVDVEAAPGVRMANAVLVQAIDLGASDIYLQSERRGGRLRALVAGQIVNLLRFQEPHWQVIVNRLQIMTDLAYGQRRWPQTGVIPVRHNGSDYQLRLTSVYAHRGDTLAIRVLPCRNLRSLADHGMPGEIQAELESLLQRESGLVLLTGPAGAGKTTTLFTLLKTVQSDASNFYTLEDPIEYYLDGVQQIALAPLPERDLGSVLPLVLRQNPEIVVIGEINDAETARHAIRAVESGRLILATMNAPDAAVAIRRLLSLGIDPEDLSRSLAAVLAQRLVPALCPTCRTSETVRADDLRPLGYRSVDLSETADLYRADGCDACYGLGVRGGTGLFELMRITPEIADLIARRAPSEELRDAATAGGMIELRRAAEAKVRAGTISLADAVQAVRDLGTGRAETEERMYRYRYPGG